MGFRRASLSLALSLLMSAFALPIPPACLTTHLHRPTERSPTMWQLTQAPARWRGRVTCCRKCLLRSSNSNRHIAADRSATVNSTLIGRMLWSRPRLKPLNFAGAKLASSKLALDAQRLDSVATSLASVPSLSPVTSSAQDDSTSELLRFL